jgi:hypothetical protein
MSETVTYRGPADGTESDNYVVLPPVGEEGETYSFPLNWPVPDVPDEIVEQLKATEGQHFDFGAQATKPDEPYPGYDDSEAKQIVEYLTESADHEFAARVAEYEADHKNRKTVLEAAKATSEPEVSQGP